MAEDFFIDLGAPAKWDVPPELKEISRLRALNADLLSALETLVAIDGGSWHNERYAREKPEAMARARAAIAKTKEEGR